MAKSKTNKKVTNKQTNDEVVRLIIMVVVVTVLFLIFYVITLFVTKEKPIEDTKTPASIQYDEILIGNMLTQPNEDYYVLIETLDDLYNEVYELKLQNYQKTEDGLRYYTAILDNVFNSKFKAEESNLDVDSILDIKISQTTLFKISDGKIKRTYEGKEAIIKHLDSLKEE